MTVRFLGRECDFGDQSVTKVPLEELQCPLGRGRLTLANKTRQRLNRECVISSGDIFNISVTSFSLMY